MAEEITGAATDLVEVLNGDGIGSNTVAVSGTASIVEFNTETRNIIC